MLDEAIRIKLRDPAYLERLQVVQLYPAQVRHDVVRDLGQRIVCDYQWLVSDRP